MAVPTPKDAQPATRRRGAFAEPWEPFALLVLEHQHCELQESDSGLLVVDEQDSSAGDRPEEARGWAQGLRGKLRRKKADEGPAVDFEANSPAELLEWLFDRLDEDDNLVRLVPTGEPRTVHEITDRLFSAYEAEGGSLHLGGCHLEDIPFLRLSWIDLSADSPQVAHRFYDAEGQPVADELVHLLHLQEVDLPEEPRPVPAREKWSHVIAAAQSHAANEHDRRAAAAVVYAKRAHGHLQVTIGEEVLDIPFEGWTRSLTAPPATCPHSGEETFHLTSLSDGRIVAAGQAVLCEETGQEILRSESVCCSVTGKTVAADCCQVCPVSGEPALPEAFAECPRCREQVSKAELTPSGCRGCEKLPPVNQGDARVAKLRATAPALASHKKWRLGETETVLIAETGGLFQRWLLVVDKQSGAVKHAAKRLRFSPHWTPLEASLLKESH